MSENTINIFADYHTHTIYSHGKGTIRENVEAAIKKGLKEIAITDHGPGHVTYGVRSRNLEKMRKEIDELNKEFSEINILLGVEANLVGCDGEIDIDKKDMDKIDILLVGFHNGALPKSISDGYKLFIRNYLSKAIPPMRGRCRDTNTQALINAVNRYKIDIITHPGAKIDIDTKKLAHAAAKRGTALEINASHGYMTVEYVKIAMTEKVKFSIDSDAHTPKNVGNFTKGIDIALKANLPADRIINAVKQ